MQKIFKKSHYFFWKERKIRKQIAALRVKEDQLKQRKKAIYRLSATVSINFDLSSLTSCSLHSRFRPAQKCKTPREIQGNFCLFYVRFVLVTWNDLHEMWQSLKLWKNYYAKRQCVSHQMFWEKLWWLMKLKLDLSSVRYAKELHQKVMQRRLLIFGFVAGVVNEFSR